MKKVLSIVLVLSMLLSWAVVPTAADAVTPFKYDVTIALPVNSPVELTFPSPIDGGGFTFYAVDRATGEEIRFAWLDYMEIYDENYYYVTGLEISYIDTYGLDVGTYDLYVINNYPKQTFGPVTLVNPGYTVSPEYIMTNQPDRSIEYFFQDGLDFDPKSVNLKIEDYSGNTVFEAEEIPVTYTYDMAFGISTAFPIDVESGAYMMTTTVNTFDGGVEELITTQINMGDNIYIESVGVTNECMTDTTPYYYAVVEFDYIPEDLHNFYVEALDYNGDVAITSDKYYIQEAYSDGATVLFRLPPPEETGGYYELYLRYNGTKEVIQTWSGSLYYSESAFSFDGAKWISEDEFQFVVRGLEAGEYNLWFYEGDTEPIGVLTMGDGEIATAKFNRKADWYDSCYVDINGEYRMIDLWDAYKEHSGIEVELDDVTFLVDNITEVSELKLNVISGEKITTDSIEEINLLRNGEVISRGSSIEVLYTGTYWSDAIKRYTNLSVSFPEFTSNLQVYETLQIQVKTAFGEATADIFVEAWWDATPGGEIHVDGASAYAGYANGWIIDLYTGTDITFESTATYSGNEEIDVYLYKYNSETGEEEYVQHITADDLTFSQINNYAESYTGEFKNLDADCLYRIGASDDGMCTYFRTTDEPLFVTYDTLYAYEDIADVYVEGVNVSDSATIRAYYLNDSGSKVSVDVTKYIENGSGSLSFDFSNKDFGAKTIYLTCNGEAAGTLVAYDMRNTVPVAQVDLDVEGREIVVYSGNSDKYANPVLKVSPLELVDFKEVVSNTSAAQTSVKFNYNMASVSSASLGVKSGYYAVSLWDGSALVSGVEIMYIDAEGTVVEKPELDVAKITTNTSKVKVQVENISDKDAENVEILLAAYNNEGIMIGVVSATKTIKASGEETVSFDKISGATEYKAYVWEKANNMIPLSK